MYVYFVSARVATDEWSEYVNILHYSKEKVVRPEQIGEIIVVAWGKVFEDNPVDYDAVHLLSINFLHEVPDE